MKQTNQYFVGSPLAENFLKLSRTKARAFRKYRQERESSPDIIRLHKEGIKNLELALGRQLNTLEKDQFESDTAVKV